MKFCPHCGADLTPYLAIQPSSVVDVVSTDVKIEYDQTKTWKGLQQVAQARMAEPPSPIALVADIRKPGPTDRPLSSIVHLVFDRNVIPTGGVLQMAVEQDGKVSMSPELLVSMGYVMAGEKVKVVDGAPVGRAYTTLEYWGGDRQYKRWHLAAPIQLVPSRSGDPFFMDDNMIAFGAIWKDCTKLEDALLELLNLFVSGIVGEETVGIPVALAIVWR